MSAVLTMIGVACLGQLPPANTGSLYVSDFWDDEVAVLSPAGEELRTFTAEGLRGPRGRHRRPDLPPDPRTPNPFPPVRRPCLHPG